MRWVRDRISTQQQEHAYAWRTLPKLGVHVAGGSDAPIENHSPLLGLHDAIYRCARRLPEVGTEVKSAVADTYIDVVGNTSTAQVQSTAELIPAGYTYDHTDVYKPQECVSFAEALYMYTVGAAYASCSETVLGRVEVGYKADLTVVDSSVFTNNRLLFNAKPTLVLVDGDIKFNSHSTLGDSRSNGSNGDNRARVEGPFIPGKNGSIHGSVTHTSFRCACLLLGKYCIDI